MCDGAIIPTSIAAHPGLLIAALAERTASLLARDLGKVRCAAAAAAAAAAVDAVVAIASQTINYEYGLPAFELRAQRSTHDGVSAAVVPDADASALWDIGSRFAVL